MDVEDVSNVSEYISHLNRQKEILRTATRRKGELPRDRKPRAQIIMQFGMESLWYPSRRNHVLRHFFVVPPYLPCTASLEDLKSLLVKDLRLETHHRGFYILLRTITPPCRAIGITVVTEDESDEAVTLQLYQQEGECDQQAKYIIPEGSVCILKEPYFRIQSDEQYGLQVDHVNDLMMLSKEDERIPLEWRPRLIELDKSANDWKMEGNDALKAGNFSMAVKNYSSALQCPVQDAEARTIKLNRALANLKLRCFDAALEDANCAPVSEKKREKGLYRAAQALYELGRFQESYESLRNLVKEFPSNKAGNGELSRIVDRLKEQKHGYYNFSAMYKSIEKCPAIDQATYKSALTIKVSAGRGRGVFTTKAVKAGTLLLCEKAFAYCYSNGTEGSSLASSQPNLLINIQTGRMTIGTQGDLITKIAWQLSRNPSTIPILTALHHGTYESTATACIDGLPVVDTFLIERIVALNAFGCPPTSLESHFKSTKTKGLQQTFHSTGIWITASYINHSCCSNVRRSFIGDMQIVRATCNLPADTEITIRYNIAGTESYTERQKGLENWDFKCNCTLCQADKSISKKLARKRQALLEDLNAAFTASDGVQLPKVERLLTVLEQTYKASSPTEVPRLALWNPYLVLTRMYAAKNNREKVIHNALKCLTSLGFVIKGGSPVNATSSAYIPLEVEKWGLIVDHLVEVWIHLQIAYTSVAPKLCGQAAEYAKITYRICVGEDTTYIENYGQKVAQIVSGSLSWDSFLTGRWE